MIVVSVLFIHMNFSEEADNHKIKQLQQQLTALETENEALKRRLEAVDRSETIISIPEWFTSIKQQSNFRYRLEVSIYIYILFRCSLIFSLWWDSGP